MKSGTVQQNVNMQSEGGKAPIHLSRKRVFSWKSLFVWPAFVGQALVCACFFFVLKRLVQTATGSLAMGSLVMGWLAIA